MPIHYIETYRILDVNWGIEDHKDGRPADDHFFHDKFLSGEQKRFHLWRGGGGFGQCDTIAEARKEMHSYAERLCKDEERTLKVRLGRVTAARDALRGDVFNLGRFRLNSASTKKAKR